MRKETAREFLARRLAIRRQQPFNPIEAFGLPLYDVPEKEKPQEGGS